MKNLLMLSFLTITISVSVFCQPPQAFKYQALVRDNSGEILQNQIVGLQISIHDATAGGTIVYQETFLETTNDFGLVNLEIGTGTTTIGTFESIEWGSDSKFIETEIYDGGSYVSMGTSQLLSVPYALFSERSWNAPWETSGNNIYFNDGDVGIGTQSSGYKLQVKSSGTSDGIGVTSSDDDLLFRIRENSDGTSTATVYDQNGNVGIFLHGAAYSYFNAGNVGIGTTNPQFKLDISNPVAGESVEASVRSNDAGGAIAAYSSSFPAPEDHFAGRVSLLSNASTASGLDLRAEGISSDIRFYTGGVLPENERMRIDSSGKVGIGTTNPIYHLQVSDTITDGYADIGVSAKDANGSLAVYSSTYPAPFDHFADRVSLLSNGFTSSGIDIRADGPSSDIRFYTGGVLPENERLRIDSSGEVVIGSILGYENPRVTIGSEGWIYSHNSIYEGILISNSASDGLYIDDAGGDGVSVYNVIGDGVSVDGVLGNGVYTSWCLSGYGFYTTNVTYSAGGYLPAKSGSFAKNTGQSTLEPGDLVCIAGGFEKNMLGDEVPVINIIKASSKKSTSIFGVVESRVYIHEESEELKNGETKIQKSFRFSDEEIQSGDYLVVIVLGTVDVKVDPTENIQSGETLTVGDGFARKVRTRVIEGITVAENIGILGKALEDSNGKNKIKVFVNCK